MSAVVAGIAELQAANTPVTASWASERREVYTLERAALPESVLQRLKAGTGVVQQQQQQRSWKNALGQPPVAPIPREVLTHADSVPVTDRVGLQRDLTIAYELAREVVLDTRLGRGHSVVPGSTSELMRASSTSALIHRWRAAEPSLISAVSRSGSVSTTARSCAPTPAARATPVDRLLVSAGRAGSDAGRPTSALSTSTTDHPLLEAAQRSRFSRGTRRQVRSPASASPASSRRPALPDVAERAAQAASLLGHVLIEEALHAVADKSAVHVRVNASDDQRHAAKQPFPDVRAARASIQERRTLPRTDAPIASIPISIAGVRQQHRSATILEAAGHGELAASPLMRASQSAAAVCKHFEAVIEQRTGAAAGAARLAAEESVHRELSQLRRGGGAPQQQFVQSRPLRSLPGASASQQPGLLAGPALDGQLSQVCQSLVSLWLAQVAHMVQKAAELHDPADVNAAQRKLQRAVYTELSKASSVSLTTVLREAEATQHATSRAVPQARMEGPPPDEVTITSTTSLDSACDLLTTHRVKLSTLSAAVATQRASSSTAAKKTAQELLDEFAPAATMDGLIKSRAALFLEMSLLMRRRAALAGSEDGGSGTGTLGSTTPAAGSSATEPTPRAVNSSLASSIPTGLCVQSVRVEVRSPIVRLTMRVEDVAGGANQAVGATSAHALQHTLSVSTTWWKPAALAAARAVAAQLPGHAHVSTHELMSSVASVTSGLPEVVRSFAPAHALRRQNLPRLTLAESLSAALAMHRAISASALHAVAQGVKRFVSSHSTALLTDLGAAAASLARLRSDITRSIRPHAATLAWAQHSRNATAGNVLLALPTPAQLLATRGYGVDTDRVAVPVLVYRVGPDPMAAVFSAQFTSESSVPTAADLQQAQTLRRITKRSDMLGESAKHAQLQLAKAQDGSQHGTGIAQRRRGVDLAGASMPGVRLMQSKSEAALLGMVRTGHGLASTAEARAVVDAKPITPRSVQALNQAWQWVSAREAHLAGAMPSARDVPAGAATRAAGHSTALREAAMAPCNSGCGSDSSGSVTPFLPSPILGATQQAR